MTSTYVVVIILVFTGFASPMAAFHADMYLPPSLAIEYPNPLQLIFAARPVLWMMLDVFGHFGFETSVLLTTLVSLIDLSLFFLIFERFALRRAAPRWIILLTALFAMTAPYFYFDTAYDLGTTLAMLFGLCGLLLLEEDGFSPKNMALALILFILSALSKESFLLPLLLYCSYKATVETSTTRIRISIVLLPLIAGSVAFIDARIVNSPFLRPDAPTTDPYAVSLAITSIASTLAFYFGPLMQVSLTVAFISLLFLVVKKGRLGAGLLIIFGGLLASVPYLLLPNHELGYYEWVPIPFLMLLIPCGLVRASEMDGATSRLEDTFPIRIVTYLSAALVFWTVAYFASYDRNDPGQAWSLYQQDINRNLLAEMHLYGPQIDSAKSVLVCGLTFPFHPWEHADFASSDIGFRGTWFVATEPGQGPLVKQATAVPISYDAIRWDKFDRVIVADSGGTFATFLTGAEMQVLTSHAQRPYSNISIVRSIIDASYDRAATRESIPYAAGKK